VTSLEELDQSSSGGSGTSLTISAQDILGDANLGDSISVNGSFTRGEVDGYILTLDRYLSDSN
jgi:riboflavin synthase alpha subunit